MSIDTNERNPLDDIEVHFGEGRLRVTLTVVPVKPWDDHEATYYTAALPHQCDAFKVSDDHYAAEPTAEEVVRDLAKLRANIDAALNYVSLFDEKPLRSNGPE